MANREQEIALANVVGWIRTAKETLPTINDGAVTPDRVAAASALLDRMHKIAAELLRQTAMDGRRAA